MDRKPYPSDVGDDEWAFVATYVVSMAGVAPVRESVQREAFNGLRWLAQTGAPWQMLPHDLPPWQMVYQLTRRWLKAGIFEVIVHDLRSLSRMDAGRARQASMVVLDCHNSQSMPEHRPRPASDSVRQKQGSEVHLSGAACNGRSALHGVPAAEQNRAQGTTMVHKTLPVSEYVIEVAVVNQESTGEKMAAVVAQGVPLAIVTLPEATNVSVFVPRLWVVEESKTWAARFRRLVHDYERLSKSLEALHS